jgi:hypothetical protein
MIQNLLRHTVDVKRPAPSKGISGGEEQTPSTPYSSVPCLVQPVQANWLVQYQRRAIDVTHTVFIAPYTVGGDFDDSFGPDFDISTSVPILLNGDYFVYAGRTLLIRGIRDLQEWGRVLAVDCLEVK